MKASKRGATHHAESNTDWILSPNTMDSFSDVLNLFLRFNSTIRAPVREVAWQWLCRPRLVQRAKIWGEKLSVCLFKFSDLFIILKKCSTGIVFFVRGWKYILMIFGSYYYCLNHEISELLILGKGIKIFVSSFNFLFCVNFVLSKLNQYFLRRFFV